MDIPTTSSSRRRAARAIGTALAAALVLALPGPSLAQDPADDIAFPVTLAGEQLEVATFSGPEYIEQFSAGGGDAAFIEGTEALVEGVGATLDDLTVKSALYEPAEGEHAVVAAFRIDDVEARRFAEDAIQLLLGDVVMPELLLRPVAGKWVLRVTDASMPGVYPRTVYLRDDTVWIIEADEEYVWDVLDQLPGEEPAAAVPGEQMVDQVPVELDGRRRTGLYEATEPLFLPTLSERLEEPLERWLLDLYLEAGISPAQMIGLVTWWGIESSQDSVQIEGYQVPGAGPELVERLRSEVLLAEGADLPEGVTRSEGEIGGRSVATIDFGSVPTPTGRADRPQRDPAAEGFPTPKLHVFSSGDTVWVVTDHVGEPELAAEAIAALP